MTDEERTQKIQHMVLTYLHSATPEQLHLYAARSNYDDNDQAVGWMIDSPRLDRGTALLLYWYLGAAGFANHASEDEARSWEKGRYLRVRLLEQRILEDFYTNSDIAFDPMTSEGGGPREMNKSRVKRPVPEALLQPSPGQEVDIHSDEYDDGLPLALCESIHALFDE